MLLKDLRPDVLSESKDENKTYKKAPSPGNMGKYITVAQAAKILNVTPSRVRQFIMDGRLKKVNEPAEGQRDNILDMSEVSAFAKKERKITGRPDEGKGFAKTDDKD